MKKPLEYLAKGLGVSHTALWILLLAALVVWLAMGAPMPQVGPAVPRQQPSQLVEGSGRTWSWPPEMPHRAVIFAQVCSTDPNWL